jgi:hypothetical protein
MPVTQYGVGPGLQDMSLMANGGGYTYANNLTARAGGGQANATQLTACLNRVTVVATAADSVQLPQAVGGQAITVINAGGGNSLQMFGQSGLTDTINGTAGSTGIAIASGKSIELFSFPGAWHGVLSA